ncbi:unnamed protein product [Sphagnum troendelagicum]|uniref:mRNA-decapping enzyme-like protein n=2 Tax=Sphagnum TaxID=13804 RepID=A0ABP0TW76_9BRYO
MAAQQQQTGKPLPQLDQNSTKELNLTVLQRMDRHVEDILTTAAHVTFYQFSVEDSQWSRKDVEGSLFVVKRRTQPRFQFVVMNRRSTDNLVEDLLGEFEYEVQVPYLLYRNSSQQVHGIWFYNPRECEEVAKLFQRILSAFSNKPQKVNLFSSRSEYQELEPMATMMEGPLEPSAGALPSVAEGPDEPLERFFSNAGRSSTPDITPTTVPRPAASTHTLPTRTALVPSTNIAHMPVPPSTTSLPHTSLAPPLSLDTPTISNPLRTTLIPPAFFIPPPRTSAPTATPPLAASTSALQSTPHGAPLLQPFPPPNPPPSLAQPMLHSGPITRDGVHEALQRLFKNDHFIDMVYREMLNAHSM